MSDRLARLNLVLGLKQKATQRAYKDLANAKEQFSINKQRHEQLVEYRQDYLQQLEQLGNQGSSVGRLRNRIDFIHHLDHALLQLSTHLGHLTKVRARMEVLYNEAKAGEEAVVKLITRIKKADELLGARAAQKESDEHAQKQWYSKRLNGEKNSFGD